MLCFDEAVPQTVLATYFSLYTEQITMMSTPVAFTGVPVARTAPKRQSRQIGVSCRAALPRWNAEAPLMKAGAAAAAAALLLVSL